MGRLPKDSVDLKKRVPSLSRRLGRSLALHYRLLKRRHVNSQSYRVTPIFIMKLSLTELGGGVRLLELEINMLYRELWEHLHNLFCASALAGEHGSAWSEGQKVARPSHDHPRPAA